MFLFIKWFEFFNHNTQVKFTVIIHLMVLELCHYNSNRLIYNWKLLNWWFSCSYFNFPKPNLFGNFYTIFFTVIHISSLVLLQFTLISEAGVIWTRSSIYWQILVIVTSLRSCRLVYLLLVNNLLFIPGSSYLPFRWRFPNIFCQCCQWRNIQAKRYYCILFQNIFFSIPVGLLLSMYTT